MALAYFISVRDPKLAEENDPDGRCGLLRFVGVDTLPSNIARGALGIEAGKAEEEGRPDFKGVGVAGELADVSLSG